ncbi:hypothetical protein BH11MYX2_BH11MYX2_37870 [soil metagenome]
MIARAGLFACVLLGAATNASAQTAPSGLPPLPQPAVAAAPVEPAWALYDAAFNAAAQNELEQATSQLRVLVQQYPQHPAAMRAAVLLASIEQTIAAPVPRHNGRARGELVFWQTANGAYISANICGAIDCKGTRETAAVYLAGIGGGLGLSALASRYIHDGQAQLYNSAQAWTAWTALGVLNGVADDGGEAAVAFGMQGAGFGIAAGLWETWRPSAGDIALTNSFFIWGSLASSFGALALGSDNDSTFRKIVVAGDASIVIGALVSQKVHMSRGRTILIATGGLLGLLLGGAIALGVDSNEGIGGAFLAGEAIGIGAATLLRSQWDAPVLPSTPLAPQAIRTPGGHTAPGMGVAFQW